MNKPFVVLALLLALLIPCGGVAQTPAGQSRGKVLLIIRDVKTAEPDALEYVIAKEAGTIKDALVKAGYQVEIASPTGQRWGTQAAGLQPDRKLADVRVAEYKALVIPCLAIDSNELHLELAALIKAAVASRKLIAGQNGGVTMLAKAGVLTGKKYAALEFDGAPSELAKGIYAGTGVVKDGDIITSGTCAWMAHAFPGMVDGTPKLTETLIAELKAR